MVGLFALRRDRPPAAFVGIRWSAAVDRRHRFRPPRGFHARPIGHVFRMESPAREGCASVDKVDRAAYRGTCHETA